LDYKVGWKNELAHPVLVRSPHNPFKIEWANLNSRVEVTTSHIGGLANRRNGW